MNIKVKFPGGKPEKTDGRKRAKIYARRFFLMPVCLVMAAVILFSTAGCGPAEGGTEPSQTAASADVKMITLNIAAQDMTTKDYLYTVKYPGQDGNDYSYALRRQRLDALIETYMPDVLMLQEVNGSKFWWPYLVSDADSFLNTFDMYELVGRTNRIGGTDGAGDNWYDLYNQIYYNKNKFDAVATGMFYLNSKRTQPFTEEWHESAYYDSDDNNTCVWAVLKDKKTGISAVYASTHLKTAPYLARAITNYRQAVNLADGLYEISVQYADAAGALPIVVAGDFNMTTDQNYNKTYPYLTEDAFYSDARVISGTSDTRGTARVWGKNITATKNDGCTSDGYRIDYFFTQAMEIEEYECLNGVFIEDSEGFFYDEQFVADGSGYDLSDHLPVYVEAKIAQSDRNIREPLSSYRNTAADGDEAATAGESQVSSSKIIFGGDDLLEYFGESGQYMHADAVRVPGEGNVLRLMAEESCANVYTLFDYAALMQSRGLTPAEISDYSRIRIRYKTCLTVAESEWMLGILCEGAGGMDYTENATKMTNSNNGFTEQVYEIALSPDASGKITGVVFGTMAYMSDYAGTCGMYAGDCFYISSIEFLE